ncbi:MAG: DUF4829 domain-containing protein [Thermoanaerobacteraceae bacterium]|nr:DUF4829 domain-containing protein [Thermoanaerobacteraceae bacterium]
MSKKRVLLFILLAFLGLQIIGCGHRNATGEGENASDKHENSIDVIYSFAKFVNEKNYPEALSLLTLQLRGGFSMGNNAPLRNIEHMEITRVKDMSNRWSPGRSAMGAAEVRIYYVEIDYKIKGIIFSYLKDGPYYHKVVVLKETPDSPWLIDEMSTAPKQP